jgi:DNA-binding NtrC family response regulator
MNENLERQIGSAASSGANITVLISSPVESERGRLAKLVHDKGARSNKPFVTLNCAAINDALLESELFGHEKGSFYGAYTSKIGLAEIANGGTLFLDNVEYLSQGTQAQLHRFINDGTIFRVGGRDPIKVDVRLISGTDMPKLEGLVNTEHFREDLYYQINTITIYGEEKAPLKADDFDPGIELHEVEKRHILKTLNHFDNNKTRAAHALGITIKTLYNKLHLYGEL